MNSTDINLLSTSPVSRDKEKRLKQVRTVAVIFILLVGLASIFTFVLNISSPLDKIKAQQNDILSQITAQQDKAGKLAVVNERIVSISGIYKKRPDYVEILSRILSKKDQSIKISALDIGESSITVTVSSGSLLSLNNFLNSVIDSLKSDKKVGSVFLDSLSVSQLSSSYTMGIRVGLNEQKN